MVCAASPAFAQLALRRDLPAIRPVASLTAGHGELHGVVRDDRGRPLRDAVVSALGATTAFAVSDHDGHYVFRNLPPGPYLVRAYLQGYLPQRGRVIQVNADGQSSWAIALTRSDASADPQVLAAGIGPVDESSADGADDADRSEDEVTWRLRHAKRSVLKDAETQIAEATAADGPDARFDDVRRAVETPIRLASLLGDLNGEVNFLTTTAFDRPQDLFSVNAGMPRGIAYLSLAAPTPTGEWTMRGTITEGDLSSWILAGAYVRRGPAAHRYEAGYSYSMQRYQGGNAEALAAMRDGSRTVGELYAYDHWTLNRRLTLHYGAKYADYAYLESPRLVSPRVNVDLKPFDDPLTVRVAVAHRETAPGAEEFVPPAVGPWLPPERTFSSISGGNAFTPERLDHVEVAAERPIAKAVVIGVRAFRQHVDDQVVTLFGVAMADDAATLGHYQVGSAGNFEAHGWGVRASRSAGPFQASVDYSQSDAQWLNTSPDAAAISAVAASLLRRAEHIHDLTSSLEAQVAPTSTRVLVLYKMNTALSGADSGVASRFNVQVNQALPFLNFSGAQVEMIVAVRNMFYDDPFDGSVYDELLVLHPPKRILGGVTVRF
jgi:hypothetical protein